jgi:3-oxoadipate enol-lactonase
MAGARDSQMAFMKSHNLREIAEERVGVAFTASAQGVRAWMVGMIVSGDKEGYASQAQATLMGFDVRSRLKEIHVPTTIIHGEKDATAPVALAEVEAQEIPDSALHVLQGDSHFANVHVPEKVNPRSSPVRWKSRTTSSRSGRRADRSLA